MALKNLLKVFVMAALIVTAAQSSASAVTEPCEIVNDSDMSIASLYVIPMDYDGWGDDLVGYEIMNCGDYRSIRYDPDYTYKIKIALANNEGTFTFYNVSLLDTWRLGIFYNGTDFEFTKNVRG